MAPVRCSVRRRPVSELWARQIQNRRRMYILLTNDACHF